MSNRKISTAIITFDDGSFVKWEYLGKAQLMYRPEDKWKISVRVEQSPAIDQFFESWDKPSINRADYFIKDAIKVWKESQ